jgi:uncharacterized phage protein (TIGR01671 family)
MREILFRGKTESGEWVEGTYYHQTEFYGDSIDASYIISSKDVLEDNMMIFCEVIPETVGQFTGLTDMDGKKIFEGDIVECISSDGIGKSKIDTIKVKDMTDYNTMVYLNCSNELKVIGNIQDSPKPFKGGADNV